MEEFTFDSAVRGYNPRYNFLKSLAVREKLNAEQERDNTVNNLL